MQSTFIQAKTVSLGKSVKLDDLKDVKIGALQKGSQLVYDDVEEQFISLPPNLSERTYGTTTQIPKLTIDSYGRISSIEEVSLFIGSTLGLIDDDGIQIEMPLDQVLTIKGGTGVTTSVQGASDFIAEISIGQDVATTADVTFNKVTLSAVPTIDNDAATKEYVDSAIIRTAGACTLILNENVNALFGDSGYRQTSVLSTNTFVAPPYDIYGFYPVQNAGSNVIISPYQLFGPNVDYKIFAYNTYLNGFGDGLHFLLTRTNVSTDFEESIPNFGTSASGSFGNTLVSEASITLNTGNTDVAYYFKAYYAAYTNPADGNQNGATIRDTTIYLQRV